MTTAALFPAPISSEPSLHRAGLPWSGPDYEAMARSVAEGYTLEETASLLGRTPAAIIARLRRLLPPDERRLPQDLVAGRLHDLFTEDPAYDWRNIMLKDPPPAPVHKPADIIRTGIDGLTDEQLVVVAFAVLVADTAFPDDTGIGRDILAAAYGRGLDRQLLRRRITLSRRRGEIPGRHADEEAAAELWIEASRLFTEETAQRRRRCQVFAWQEPHAAQE